MDLLLAALIGVGAGVTAGLFGVGGGVIFVPALVLVLGLNQHEAIATSLLAIIPVALVGARRQHGYGNVRVREGLWIGVLAAPSAWAAAELANALGESTLKFLFVGLLLYVAFRMGSRALWPDAGTH